MLECWVPEKILTAQTAVRQAKVAHPWTKVLLGQVLHCQTPVWLLLLSGFFLGGLKGCLPCNSVLAGMRGAALCGLIKWNTLFQFQKKVGRLGAQRFVLGREEGSIGFGESDTPRNLVLDTTFNLCDLLLALVVPGFPIIRTAL